MSEQIADQNGNLYEVHQSALSSTEKENALQKAHDRSAELDKIAGLESSASEIDALSAKNYTSQLIKSKLQNQGLIITVLGDSTEGGVGSGGGAYAQCNSIDKSGAFPLWVYSLIRSDDNFIDLNQSDFQISTPYNTNDGGLLDNVPFSSYHLVKDDNPVFNSIFYSKKVTGTEDVFTIYGMSRTSDASLIFDVNIYDDADTLIGTSTVDTYASPEVFGAVATEDVDGRFFKHSITLTSSVRTARVEFSNYSSHGGGNGTGVIFGFAWGNGVDFNNLSVSSTTLLENSSANQARGITTSERLALAQSYNTNCYIIGWGTNDSKTGISSPSQFEGEYIALIDSIRTTKSDAIIILCTDPKGETGSIYENNVIFNEVIRKVASLKNCMLFDVEYLSLNLLDFYADEVHPSTKGVAQIKSSFLDFTNVNNAMIDINDFKDDAPRKFGYGYNFAISEPLTVGNTLTEIFSEGLPRRNDANYLKVKAKLNIASGTDIENAQLKLYINNSLQDETIVNHALVGSVAICEINVSTLFAYADSDIYTVSLKARNITLRQGDALSNISMIYM